MDSVSEERLAQVNPKLAALVRQMADQLASEAIDVRVTQGLRTWAEQAALYEQGRSTSGPRVTNAPPGYSYHNFGLAVDLVPMIDIGPDWNTSHPVWQRMVTVGQSVGLTAGALWRTFPDRPHFQLTGRLPMSPDADVRLLFQDGGLARVWEEAGLAAV
jgi:peptidoglycan LD-endopeptidase CwlK